MISISKNDFRILSFLIRDFSAKYTMRNIAITLQLSPAGVFTSLKKLEKAHIVTSEKLGTGLFFSLNLKNKIAQHLAAIAFLGETKADIDIERTTLVLEVHNDVLVITDAITDITVANFNIHSLTESEFLEKIRAKDPDVLRLIKEGTALHGELELIKLIKRGTYQ